MFQFVNVFPCCVCFLFVCVLSGLPTLNFMALVYSRVSVSLYQIIVISHNFDNANVYPESERKLCAT